MLVLSRKKGQAVTMSNGIIVRVLKNQANQIVLGFEAPKEIKIWREELAAQKMQALSEHPLLPI